MQESASRKSRIIISASRALFSYHYIRSLSGDSYSYTEGVFRERRESFRKMLLNKKVHRSDGKSNEKYTNCLDAASELIQECANVYPSSTKIKQLVKANPLAPFKTDDHGMLALHCACLSFPSLAVVEYLVKANKDAVKTRDYFGRFPLHCACMHQANLQVIQYLVRVYPEAIESPEQKGIFPFHFACMGPTDLDVIQYLRSIYPASISMSVGGLYPLHFACANGALPKVIEYLIHESKGALYVRIACGLIPLHFACNNQASPEVLVTLIQAWPDSISVENKQGRTLLEFSIK